jgi:hypothetical protein
MMCVAQANHDTESERSRDFELHHRATWNRIQVDLDTLGDSPDRLNYVCPKPTYPRATVSMPFVNLASGTGITFRVRAVAVGLYIDRGFWDMWNFVVNADPRVSVFWRWDVVLEDDSPEPSSGTEATSSPALGPASTTRETDHFDYAAEAPDVEAPGVEAPAPRRRRRDVFSDLSYRLRPNSVRRALSRK